MNCPECGDKFKDCACPLADNYAPRHRLFEAGHLIADSLEFLPDDLRERAQAFLRTA
jgi:hypothetical protein